MTQLKLVSLYLSYELNDPAELMLDHILKNTPNQEAAITMKKHLLAHKKEVITEV